jgi:hypothetical protein
VNGNWAQLDLTGNLGASTTQASLALTAFWAMVTAGRVLFAALHRLIAPQWTFHLLPFVLAGVFLAIAALPSGRPALGIAAFGLAGLACSALLPLTISFGQEEVAAASAFMAGGIIAAYHRKRGSKDLGTLSTARGISAGGVDGSKIAALLPQCGTTRCGATRARGGGRTA